MTADLAQWLLPQVRRDSFVISGRLRSYWIDEVQMQFVLPDHFAVPVSHRSCCTRLAR